MLPTSIRRRSAPLSFSLSAIHPAKRLRSGREYAATVAPLAHEGVMQNGDTLVHIASFLQLEEALLCSRLNKAWNLAISPYDRPSKAPIDQEVFREFVLRALQDPLHFPISEEVKEIARPSVFHQSKYFARLLAATSQKVVNMLQLQVMSSCHALKYFSIHIPPKTYSYFTPSVYLLRTLCVAKHLEKLAVFKAVAWSDLCLAPHMVPSSQHHSVLLAIATAVRLGYCTKLTTLVVKSSNTAPVHLECLTQLPALHTLQLQGFVCSMRFPVSWSVLAQFSQLHTLQMISNVVDTFAWCKVIKEMKNLHSLTINPGVRSWMTMEQMLDIMECDSLRVVSIWRVAMHVGTGVAFFKHRNMENLESLIFYVQSHVCEMVTGGLQGRVLPNLRKLKISLLSTKFPPQDFAPLFASFAKITHLWLFVWEGLDSAKLKCLGQCADLEVICFQAPSRTDGSHLAHLLHDADITLLGKACPRLERVTFGLPSDSAFPLISGKGFTADQFPKLEKLTLFGCGALDSEGLQVISKLPSLCELNTNRTKASFLPLLSTPTLRRLIASIPQTVANKLRKANPLLCITPSPKLQQK